MRMAGELTQAVEALRAAGEPTRLRILALLAHEELAVMEICQALAQSQPRVSRHLKLLAESGLIERFPDGGWVFYRLAESGALRALADQALDLAGDDADFIRDAERLKDVQADRTRRAAAYFAEIAPRWDELRSLYVAEADVEAAILDAAGEGPFEQLVDLGTGSGRMLTLLGARARRAIGLDLSRQMLNVARAQVERAGLEAWELRQGDIFSTRLPAQCADLVIAHQVLHFLTDPAAAVTEAGRLVAPGGRLVIVDFAPHALEQLRESHQHRRLGFTDGEMARWLGSAGLDQPRIITLQPRDPGGLTVKVWAAGRKAEARRAAA
ncbi:MAG: ArsR/SmtB family transcription factor [Caulobacteraceae bacterium]